MGALASTEGRLRQRLDSNGIRFGTLRRRAIPRSTAFDLVGYPERCGGLDHVATVFAELAEKLDAKRLADMAPLSPIPWAQRLGYLLVRVGQMGRNCPR